MLLSWSVILEQSDRKIKENCGSNGRFTSRLRQINIIDRLRFRSRNHWMRNNFSEALNDNLLALHVLGIEVNAKPSQREADVLFEQVKNEILAVGFDEILSIPQATDSRTDVAVAILNDAGEWRF